TRLLSADPMNGEAAEALTRARGRAAQSAAPSTPAPAPAPTRAAAPEPVVRLVPDPAPRHSFTTKPPPPPAPHPPPAPLRRDFVVEHESEARVADAVPTKSAPPPGEIETYDGTLDFNSVAHDAAKAEGLEVTEEVELKPQDLVVEGLAHTQYESALAPPAGVSPSEDGLPSGDRGARGRDTGESVPTFLRRILAGRPPARGEDDTGDPEPLTAPESPGSPLDGAFAIASLEPEPEPEVVAPGEATRPAEDSITLDAVFGEEGPRSVPPADAGARPAVEPAPASPPPPGGFSFDQFFTPPSAPPGGAAPPAEGGAAFPGPARSSGSRARPPMEDEGDLDQFQAWLRGLKS